MSVDAVREIDTSLFCQLRRYLDDIDGIPYKSIPPSENRNCTRPRVADLQQDGLHGLISYYSFEYDTEHKLVDISGNNMHGWAPNGTQWSLDNSEMGESQGRGRAFFRGQFAALPVPIDWDLREAVFAFELKLSKDMEAQTSTPLFHTINCNWDGIMGSQTFNGFGDGLTIQVEKGWFDYAVLRVEWLAERMETARMMIS